MIIVFAFIIGVLLWPVLEYVLHRFLGHVLKLKTEFKKQHTRHHAETHYFAPNSLKVMAAIPVSALFFLLFWFLSGSWQIALGFISGFVLMYAFYEWTHWSFHNLAPRTLLGLKLRKHHFAHHFHNAKMNHGVTSTLLDHACGTYLEVPVVKVPKQFKLSWLESGDYSSDFILK